MTISNTSNTITIKGNIKSINDYQSIKSAIDSMISSHRSITIDIKDSISITSSAIGYFTRVVQKDGVDLHIKVGNDTLMELLDDLNLIAIFHVTRS